MAETADIQTLQDIKRDADDLARVAGGAATDPDVETRLAGLLIPTVARVIAEMVATNPVHAPVEFASGLDADDRFFTVHHEGYIYAARASAVPFTTTATFDPGQWSLIAAAGLDMTAADVASRSLPADLMAFRTSGHTVPGDGGGALYTRAGGAATLLSADGADWQIAEPVLRPEMLGAKGTGAVLDTVAWQATIAAAGVDGVVEGRPGATYLVDSELIPLAGQKIRGNGAVIKRANQYVTTLTAASTSGTSPTVLEVDDASGFRVGSKLTITKGGGLTDTSNHLITAIAGDQVTVNATFSSAYAIGDQVISSYMIFKVLAGTDDVEISGWEFDGNRASWQTAGLRWENIVEILAGGNRGRVSDNYLHDIPVEGCIFGGNGSIFEKNTLITVGGNGAHFSGGESIKCLHNWLEDCNDLADPDVVGTPNMLELGHQDGSITWSQQCRRVTAAHNTVINGKLAAFGEFSSEPSSEVNITDNVVIGAYQPFMCQLVGGGGEQDRIAGNHFINCTEDAIIGTTAAGAAEAASQSKIILDTNFWENCGLHLKRAYAVKITGDTFFRTDADLAVASTTLTLTEAKHIKVDNVDFDGHYHGVFADALCEWVAIKNSKFRRGRIYGANLAAADNRRIEFSDNEVVSGASSATTYRGAMLPDGAIARNNNMDLTMAAPVAPAACITAASGAILTGNVLRSSAGIHSIRFDGGTSGGIATMNFTQQAISDAGANTLATNYAI